MDSRHEILDAIEILIKKAQENTTKIQQGIVIAVYAQSKCDVKIDGKLFKNLQYFGGKPTINKQCRVLVPNGNMSSAFVVGIVDS